MTEENTINIQEKLKIYFDICNDIKTLEDAKTEIRLDLENYLKKSGVDSVKTTVGSVSYVNKNYETIDKVLLESFLNEQQREKVFIKKESKYIKITPIRKDVNLKETNKDNISAKENII
jgi:hypothetical protein